VRCLITDYLKFISAIALTGVMAELFHREHKKQRVYFDRQQFRTLEDQYAAVRSAKMVYVGNLSAYTTEFQIHATFSRAGPVKRVIMGLNNITKTPCGFCFVEYYKSEHAWNCLKFISGTVCDEQIIRCELDAGFVPGRQYGRGASGGQVRHDPWKKADPLRGNLIKYETDAPTTGFTVVRRGPVNAIPLSIGTAVVSEEPLTAVAGEKRKRNRDDDDDDEMNVESNKHSKD
jgi:nuclear cap-binding protein subunit 2